MVSCPSPHPQTCPSLSLSLSFASSGYADISPVVATMYGYHDKKKDTVLITNSSTMGKPTVGYQHKKGDDALLDSYIDSNRIDKPKMSLFIIGVVAAFIPAYVFHSILALSWENLANIPLFALIPLTVAFMLSKAYAAMYETEFLKRQKHYDETRNISDAELLKSLRLQCSLGWAVYFCNLVYIATAIFCAMYVFRNMDTRLNMMASNLFAAALTLFVAVKNEDVRKKKMGAF